MKKVLQGGMIALVSAGLAGFSFGASADEVTAESLIPLLSLKCIQKSLESGVVHYPGVTVSLTPAEVQQGYAVTGGGCEVMGRPNNGTLAHNPAVTMSRPDGASGWRCEGGDPPNIVLPFSLKAHLVACRVGLLE